MMLWYCTPAHAGIQRALMIQRKFNEAIERINRHSKKRKNKVNIMVASLLLFISVTAVKRAKELHIYINFDL